MINLIKLLTILLALLLTPTAVKAAEPPRATARPEGTFQVIDLFGRERIVRRPVERAVVLGGAAVETIWALGAGDKIIGRSQWTIWPPAMVDRPSIGSTAHPNLELLWRLNPDVVIADSHFHHVAQRIESMGLPLIFVNGYVQPQVKDMIRILGQLFDRSDKAAQLSAYIDRLSGLLADRVGRLPAEERPRVFMGFGEQLYFTSNAKSGRRLIDLAGGINIADRLPLPYQRVSAEWVIDQNPDHLVLGADLTGLGYQVADRAYMTKLRRLVLDRPEIKALDCTRRDRIYIINHRIGYGLRNIIGALHLAKVFHPELMTDLSPRTLHREMLHRFFNLELDGVYFTP